MALQNQPERASPNSLLPKSRLRDYLSLGRQFQRLHLNWAGIVERGGDQADPSLKPRMFVALDNNTTLTKRTAPIVCFPPRDSRDSPEHKPQLRL